MYSIRIIGLNHPNHKRFGKSGTTRKNYREFVEKGVKKGRRTDLTGGGLIRTAGGWTALKAIRRQKIHIKGDERILGDSDFVESVLETQNERLERRYRIQVQGYELRLFYSWTMVSAQRPKKTSSKI